MERATGKEATLATKTRVSMRLEVGDRLAEPKGGYRIRMARGESESVEVSAELLDGGRPFDASGLSARFMAVLAGGRHVAMPVPPEGVSGGTLTYTLPSGLGATPGDTRLAVFELSDGEGYRIYTEPFTVSVTEGSSPTSAEIGPYVPELDALIAQLKAAIGSAGDAAGTASSAAAKAEAAIAEVKATEAKLYPAAENILVGSETGTVAHVEDAFNGATLRGITVEGACKQDGIPSPEEPKPITVIEHPTVNALGRNFLSGSRLAEILPAYYAADSGKVKALESCNINWLTVPSYGTLPAGTYCVSGDVSFEIKRVSDNSGLRYGNGVFKLGSDTEVKIKALTGRSEYPVTAEIQLELGAAPTAYAPYTEQQIVFNLPAEHPYLAKLPDGTADTIVVDEEGNVELVARVARRELTACTSMSDSASQSGEDGTMNYILALDGAEDAKVANAAACICTRFKNGGTTKNADTIRRGAGSELCYVYTSNSAIIGDGTTQHVTEWLAANPTEIMYEVAEPKRYPLGKIEMPKAQDSIINVWTDAEVTPNTSIEYVRDVNIVVSHLESAIASIS